jgi:hypothetical protein
MIRGGIPGVTSFEKRSKMLNETEIAELLAIKEKLARNELVEMRLEYQNEILTPPMSPKEMYAQAASGDGATMNYWEKIWLEQIAENKKTFGSFKERSIGKFLNHFKYRPCIVAGAGPSLKKNGHLLKDRGEIGLISCLHNFHFFEDRDIDVDFYVTLDAGPVTVEEVSEGGKFNPEWYWERTKTKKLLAFIGTNPELLRKWQGEIYFYSAVVPSKSFMEKAYEIERFNCCVSTGGNVLGAALYIAKGIMCANPIAFVGADFCFSYMHKFHAWDSKYDANLGQVIKMTDVYGNKVLSWQSYANFKAWFDQLALHVPGIWINCTEGGTLGAFPEGNMIQIKQMPLSYFYEMYNMSRHIEDQAHSPETAEMKVLF